jgi:hypothetical protein
MTLVIDENGVYYRVPISCINEPANYSVNFQDEKLKGKSQPPEKIFNVSYTIQLSRLLIALYAIFIQGYMNLQ